MEDLTPRPRYDGQPKDAAVGEDAWLEGKRYERRLYGRQHVANNILRKMACSRRDPVDRVDG